MKTILTINEIEYEVGKASSESANSFVVESIQLDKEMYKPGCIDIQLSTDRISTPIKTLTEDLLNKRVSLTIEDDSQQKYIYAQDYIIFSITPVIKRSNTHTSTILHLKVYSLDKYLTFQKYSKTWTAKRLYKDIISEEIKQKENTFNQALSDSKQETPDNKQTENKGENNGENNGEEESKYAKANLRHLQNGEQEFRQPYLVQYNESFYDFMTRTANRCGEFVYFENGKLNIGLPKEDNAVKPLDEAYSELSYNTLKSNAEAEMEAYNYLSEHEYPENDTYNYEGQADVYMEPINKKSKTEGWEDEIYWPECPAIGTATSILSEDTLTEMIIQAGVGLGKEVLSGMATANYQNGKYNKKYFSGKFNAEQYSDDSLCQFTNWKDKDKYGNNFYIQIRKNEENAETYAIHVKYNAYCPNLILGNIVQYNEDIYTVTHIHTVISNLDGNITITTEIEALPWQGEEGEEKLPYPFPLKGKSIKKAGNQVAFVVDNDDPLRLGRVRIRYPWQKTSDATPWVRVASPMASDGTGINFVANNGDEVMVGYEYGNVERPYVVGSLFNTGNQPDTGSTCKHMISSPNGHTVKFSDPPNGAGAYASLLPGLALLKTYFPALPIFKDSPATKNLAGGISMYDTYGFYDISMSTDKRAVSISSPLGKVSIDALTGISLEAPNGNVSITGKNVSITAGNSVTITSGQNIDNEMLRYDGFGKLLKETGKKLGETILEETIDKFIDLSLVRTLIETFIRPIGGEMLIKSYRNLKLEAGEGKATVPVRFWTNNEKENKKMMIDEAARKAKNEELKKSILEPVNSLMSRVSHYLNIYNRENFYSLADQYKINYSIFEEYVERNIQENNLKNTCAEISLPNIFEEIQHNDKFENIIVSKYQKALKAINKLGTEVEKEGVDMIAQMMKIAELLFNEYKASLPEQTIKDSIALEAFNRLRDDEKEQLIPKYSLDNEVTMIPSIKLRRKAVYVVLKVLESHDIIEFDYKSLFIKTKDGLDEIYESPLKWRDFLKYMRPKQKEEEPSGFMKNMLEATKEHIIEKSKLKGLGDTMDLWKKNYHSGEILFSDKEGKQTLRFENGSIRSSLSNDPLDEIRSILGNY